MNTRYPIITATLLLAIAGYYFARGHQHTSTTNPPRAVTSSHETSTATINIVPEPATQQVDSHTLALPKGTSEKATPASFYGITVNPELDVEPAAQRRMALVLPGAIDYRIRKQDPAMDEILLLTRDKVLRSAADNARIAELYEAEPMLKVFAQSLAKKPGKKELYRDDLQLRMHRLEFLSKALAHGQSIDKSAVIDSLKSAFIASTIEENYPLHQKKSLTYEKIKLLKLINQHDPSYVDSLRQTAEQSPYLKIYQYVLSQL